MMKYRIEFRSSDEKQKKQTTIQKHQNIYTEIYTDGGIGNYLNGMEP